MTKKPSDNEEPENNEFNMDELQALIQQHMKRSAHLADYPLSVFKRIHVLDTLQNEYETLLSQLDKEKLAVEMKYYSRFDELYKQRELLINGKAELTEEQLKSYEEHVKKEGGEVKAVSPSDAKGIPNFWYNAICNCEHLEALLDINPEDVPILAFLQNVSYEYLPDGEMEIPDEETSEMRKVQTEGFKLVFTFAQNKYFKETVLTKDFLMTREENELALIKSVGTHIEWNDKSLNPTKKTVRKQQSSRGRRGGRRGPSKPIFEEVDVPSFFSFFADSDTEKDDEEIENDFEKEYAAGVIIKEQLIPRAIDYYTGKIKCECGECDEDEDGEEDEDEEIDDEESKAKKDANGPQPNTVVENPECKQQ